MKKKSLFAVRMLSKVSLSLTLSPYIQLYSIDLCLMTNLLPFDCSCLGKSQHNKMIRKFIATTISRHFLKQYWCCSGIVIISCAGCQYVDKSSLSLSLPFILSHHSTIKTKYLLMFCWQVCHRRGMARHHVILCWKWDTMWRNVRCWSQSDLWKWCGLLLLYLLLYVVFISGKSLIL